MSDAERAGVLHSYVDPEGRTHTADPEDVRIIVEALGGPAPEPGPWPAELPRQAWSAGPGRDWGVFVPHHALRTRTTRGLGDLTALTTVGTWLGAHGGRVLGTLPLLPTFLDGGEKGPYEFSPYAPVSRHFWGEHLVDPTATPEWPDAPAAKAILDEAREDGTLERLRASELADPAGAWALQWRLLSALSEVFWQREDAADLVVQGLTDEQARRFHAYCRFRAATQVRGPWPTWTDERRFDGTGPLALDPPDVGADRVRTWAYAQHTARQQIAALRDTLARAGVELYLDLPLGTHPDGFDTFVGTGDGPLHASGVSAGCPPDAMFPGGQDWGFPPVHPHTSVRTDHADLRSALAHHARAAGRLRIDHILGFYRLFWVPGGRGATHGVYVRYPAKGWWQALVEASHDHRCAMIGENLGVVPQALTDALAEHAIPGMHVAQFALDGHDAFPLHPPRPGDLTCLNTHDTPTFGGWWTEEDLDTQVALGWLDGPREEHARGHRRWLRERLSSLADRGPLAARHDLPVHQRVGAALYAHLAATEAGTVLVTLEDLWGETRPHNVPGTWREQPNWLRRTGPLLEDALERDDVLATLQAVRAARPGTPA